MGELTGRQDGYLDALQGVDTVFHLAAIAHMQSDDDSYRVINCEATIALARQAEAAGVKRFVFVSSTKAAADPGTVRRDETWSALPRDPYGYWKRMAEKQLLEDISIPHIAVIRPCLMYGSGVKGNLLAMLRAIDKGYFPPLADSGAERSMVSVHDVARSLMGAALLPEANRRILIAADGQTYTVGNLYRAMRQALGKPPVSWSLPVGFLKWAGSCGDLVRHIWPACPLTTDAVHRLIDPAAYSAQALRNLGWEPTRTFYDELPQIVNAYRDSTQ
jgi:nucleoside-diphosphate-sugar epimerase